RELAAQIVLAEREALELGVTHPQLVSLFEVGAGGRGALIAILGLLGEQLADDVGKPARQRRVDVGERRRCARDLEMDQLERVGVRERWGAAEKLVERRTERIEVGAIVDDAIDAARLLG